MRSVLYVHMTLLLFVAYVLGTRRSVSRVSASLKAEGLKEKLARGMSKLRAILPPGVLGFGTLTRPRLDTRCTSSSVSV